MCGIVGGISLKDVSLILIDGLKKLEYRGYDSSGIALLNDNGHIQSSRKVGKVQEIINDINLNPISGNLGISHTRWATHGKPLVKNTHPIFSGDDLAVVHNGIIENYIELKLNLEKEGYVFTSDTDTEVIVGYIMKEINSGFDLKTSVKKVCNLLQGAYAIAVLYAKEPNYIMVARKGSPLVIGLGENGNFIASDPMALSHITKEFIYLSDGDIAQISQKDIYIWNQEKMVTHDVVYYEKPNEIEGKGNYPHFMLKEIFEQPIAIQNTILGYTSNSKINLLQFGQNAQEIFSQVENIQIVACGTSYHAGLIAKNLIEEYLDIPCQTEIASEFRYRKVSTPNNTLFLSISQSGETADTLAALEKTKDNKKYIARLSLCNVYTSSIARNSDLQIITKAGTEIGVASTKAFTTQLTALILFILGLGKSKNIISEEDESKIIKELLTLPGIINDSIHKISKNTLSISKLIVDKKHALFLGRGLQSFVAMEGALKLKEISYIHAEAYPAGELKHGPLALVDEEMPVIALSPDNELLHKMESNLQEVSARGGEIFKISEYKDNNYEHSIVLPTVSNILTHILYTIPLQLLAYHVSVLKGNDVDQPRNLAKSVTVE